MPLPPPPPSSPRPAGLPGEALRPPVESAVLLQGGKALDILHNGCRYRLQVTRLGKLILTK